MSETGVLKNVGGLPHQWLPVFKIMKSHTTRCKNLTTYFLRKLSKFTMATTPTPMSVLKISGLGHSIVLELPADTTTVGELKDNIFEETGLPPPYQRLISRAAKLEDDSHTLKKAGLSDRTKLMLLHSPLYAQEKDVYEKLMAISKEIDDLKASVHDDNTMEQKFVSEMVTRLCCKLDGVETAGSDNLRSVRKKLLRKAEGIESAFQKQNGNNDNDENGTAEEEQEQVEPTGCFCSPPRL